MSRLCKAGELERSHDAEGRCRVQLASVEAYLERQRPAPPNPRQLATMRAAQRDAKRRRREQEERREADRRELREWRRTMTRELEGIRRALESQ